MTENRETHPHGQNSMPGSKLDKAQQRPSSPIGGDSGIGHPFGHFKGGVESLAVMPRTVVQCPACSAWVHHDGSDGQFRTECCRTTLNRSDVGDPVACSCHN